MEERVSSLKGMSSHPYSLTRLVRSSNVGLAIFSMRLRTASALRPVSAMLLLQTPFQPLIMVVKSRSPVPCNFPNAATHVRQFGGRRILPRPERRKFSNTTSRLDNNTTRYAYNFRMLSNRWGHSWPLEWMRC